jgi:hypothetical protein
MAWDSRTIWHYHGSATVRQRRFSQNESLSDSRRLILGCHGQLLAGAPKNRRRIDAPQQFGQHALLVRAQP